MPTNDGENLFGDDAAHAGVDADAASLPATAAAAADSSDTAAAAAVAATGALLLSDAAESIVAPAAASAPRPTVLRSSRFRGHWLDHEHVDHAGSSASGGSALFELQGGAEAQKAETASQGYFFSATALARFLDGNGLSMLIRAHDAKQFGYQFAFPVEPGRPRCATVFSAPNYALLTKWHEALPKISKHEHRDGDGGVDGDGDNQPAAAAAAAGAAATVEGSNAAARTALDRVASEELHNDGAWLELTSDTVRVRSFRGCGRAWSYPPFFFQRIEHSTLYAARLRAEEQERQQLAQPRPSADLIAKFVRFFSDGTDIGDRCVFSFQSR